MADRAAVDELTPPLMAELRAELRAARARAGNRSEQRGGERDDLIAEDDEPGDTLTKGADLAMALRLDDTAEVAVDVIDAALARFDEGTYGCCLECGGAIRIARLRALPSAERCLSCQTEVERAARRPS